MKVIIDVNDNQNDNYHDNNNNNNNDSANGDNKTQFPLTAKAFFHKQCMHKFTYTTW